MASLSDFYVAPNPQAAGLIQANYDQQSGDASNNAGLNLALQKQTYETRTLPDIVNGQAAKDAFFSGATGVMGDRAAQDYTNSTGQVQTTLDQTLAQLARNRVLSGLGVQLA